MMPETTSAEISYQSSLFAGGGDPLIGVFSPCRKYRYTLWRRWSQGKSFVQFIGLNPSTADEFVNDATLRRCINFAKSWNYDGVCMTNLFAFRSKNPKVMKAAENPVGAENDKWLLEINRQCALTVAAWGTHGAFLNRAEAVVRLLLNETTTATATATAAGELKCLGLSKGGHPLHPLYQPSDCQPLPFIFQA